MSDKIWYIYHKSKQSGPFSRDELKKVIASKSLSDECLVFSQGWSDWKRLSEVREQIMISHVQTPPPPPISPVNKSKERQRGNQSNEQILTFSDWSAENSKIDSIRQARSPRRSVNGQVIVHNNDNLIFAQSANISAEGFFIKTDKQIFNIGEVIKITCRIIEIGVPFNAEAQVVRRSSGGKQEPSGYGLYFTAIKPMIVEKIRKIIIDSKAS
ncbi:MAG: GYF domain-containing protein [Proteobacteria bacterium]|nr:GYF domain-containing protein [Pseudomonadota bacterium]